MATIAEYLKIKNITKKEIGIEIEVEGTRLAKSSNLYNRPWRVEKDDSLRGECAEYVLNYPVNLDEVKGVLQSLQNAFDEANSKINDSYRTGIHVHINVQNLSPKQMITFACCYYVLEEILMNWCKPSRVGNHFCLRVRDAEYVTWLVVQALESNNIKMLYTDDIRYSSLNYKSIFDHGSLEFRGLESTTDYEKIYTWCEILLNIKNKSLLYKNPKDLLIKIKNDGPDFFLHRFLGDHTPRYLVGDYLKSVERGVFNIQDIAHCREWDSVNYNIFLKESGGF